jgi:hypothetical protein
MFIIVLALLGLVEMLLWNALIPDIFHGPELNYWQALGLLVLARILVGSRGPKRRWWKPSWKEGGKWKWKYYNGPWWSGNQCAPSSKDWNDWAHMSPEEREKAKQEWKQAKEDWKESFKERFCPPQK